MHRRDARGPGAALQRRVVGSARRSPHIEPGISLWSLDDDDVEGTPAHHDRAVPDAAALDGGTTKGHRRKVTGNPLDQLEQWLGLRDAPPTQPGPSRPARAAPHREAEVGSVAYAVHGNAPPSASATVDMLVHPVVPSDSLEGIALRYGADVHTLRRCNRLWPGDAVQMREQLLIPVDSCRWRPPNADIQVTQRRSDGSLHCVENAASNAPDAGVAVTRVDHDALTFFSGNRARPARHIPAGDMGASGVDDLLALQEARRSGRARVDVPPPKRPPLQRPPLHSSPGDTWRPNVWTLGRKPEPRTAQRTASPAPGDADAPPDDDAPLIDLDESPRRLKDLLRGPVPNQGAAAHWMRPIHESLPEGPHSRAWRPQPTASAHLLSDVVAGRVRLDDAVGSAMHELRNVTWGLASSRHRGATNEHLPM